MSTARKPRKETKTNKKSSVKSRVDPVTLTGSSDESPVVGSSNLGPSKSQQSDKLMDMDSVEPTVEQTSDTANPKADPKKKSKAINELTTSRCTFAWQLCKQPTTRAVFQSAPEGFRVDANKRIRRVQQSTEVVRLRLPRSYHGSASNVDVDMKEIRIGDDLNLIVYRWYNEKVPLPGDTRDAWNLGVNFVSASRDLITQSRHEFLGPDPRVAGYKVGGDGQIHILWWDAFLEQRWCREGDEWGVSVIDKEGEWAEVPETHILSA